MADQYELWPAGTVANADSTHDPIQDLTTGATIRFDPTSAIDNNQTTKWNDDTLAQWPDWLLITLPAGEYLQGVTVLSQESYITQFSVEISPTLDLNNMISVGNADNIQSTITDVTFPETSLCLSLRINVFAGQAGDYSRIVEVYPVYGEAPLNSYTTTASLTIPSSTDLANASAASSTTPTANSAPFSSQSDSSSNIGVIVGGVVGGVLGLALIVGLFWCLSRRTKPSTKPLPEQPMETPAELPAVYGTKKKMTYSELQELP